MSLKNKSLTTIDDFSNSEIDGLFTLADEMADNIGEKYGLLRGKVMAALFFEPSTRTRLSFEAAMHRLGGDVISVAEGKSTSMAKGETLADMARIIGSYADIIVIRHPWEGAAKVVAEYAGVPVINAGDGGHEHPSQTLCDLYTIKKEKGNIKRLKIALWGDLKHGRTVHSLAKLLARFGAMILFHPGAGCDMPEHVLSKLIKDYGGELKKYDELSQTLSSNTFPIDAMYITPDNPHQLAMIPDISAKLELESGIDALYVTRLQRERLSAEDKNLNQDYPVVNKQLLKNKQFAQALVMHPLPRVNELSRELDNDPRSMYFKQAARGIPIRMALLASILGAAVIPSSDIPSGKAPVYPVYRRQSSIICSNMKCVTNQQNEQGYLSQEFKIVSTQPLLLRCTYCEHEIKPQFVASSDWHEGTLESKKYHSAASHWVDKIKPQNLVIFSTEEAARAEGYKPSHFSESNQ